MHSVSNQLLLHERGCFAQALEIPLKNMLVVLYKLTKLISWGFSFMDCICLNVSKALWGFLPWPYAEIMALQAMRSLWLSWSNIVLADSSSPNLMYICVSTVPTETKARKPLSVCSNEMPDQIYALLLVRMLQPYPGWWFLSVESKTISSLRKYTMPFLDTHVVWLHTMTLHIPEKS
jgi:hypothetical protein